MSQPSPSPTNAEPSNLPSGVAEEPTTQTSPPPSYVKLAMRNMVRKGGKSLYHFALTTAGLLALLLGLAYLTR